MHGADKPRQLIIPMPFNAEYTFANFVRCPGNEEAFRTVSYLASAAHERITLFLHGQAGTGKTHLARALCRDPTSSQAQRLPLYVSFSRDLTRKDPDVPDWKDLSTFSLLILENVDCLSTIPRADDRVFELFNFFHRREMSILLTSRSSPAELTALHQRLKSRFMSGTIVNIGHLDEETCLEILKKLARDNQVTFPEQVMSYLMLRVPRNPHLLRTIFFKIDERALSLKKPITIPLARNVIEIMEIMD